MSGVILIVKCVIYTLYYRKYKPNGKGEQFGLPIGSSNSRTLRHPHYFPDNSLVVYEDFNSLTHRKQKHRRSKKKKNVGQI